MKLFCYQTSLLENKTRQVKNISAVKNEDKAGTAGKGESNQVIFGLCKIIHRN